MAREMAEAIRLRRISNINALEPEFISPGPAWQELGLSVPKTTSTIRNPCGRAIESSHIKETTPVMLRQWFDELNGLIDDHNVD